MVRRVAQVSGDCWERPPVAASLRSIAALVTHPWVAGRLAARWPTGSRGAVGRPGLRPRRRYPAARATTMGPRSLSGHTSHARSNRSGETRTTRRPGPACRAGLPGQVTTAGPTDHPPGRETAPTPAGRPRLAGLSVATPWHPQTTVAGPGHDTHGYSRRAAIERSRPARTIGLPSPRGTPGHADQVLQREEREATPRGCRPPGARRCRPAAAATRRCARRGAGRAAASAPAARVRSQRPPRSSRRSRCPPRPAGS